jgi:hypothetical protein
VKVTRWLIMTSLLGVSGCPITWSNLQELITPGGAPAKGTQPSGSGSAASHETGWRASARLPANS